MINKKSPGPDRDDHGTVASRHQELLEMYRHSGQTPQEFVTDCLQNRMLSGADALELMSVLTSKTTTRSFALADLTDEEFFRMGFYETTREDTENSPIFIMQFNNELVEHSEAIQTMLEQFSRDLAELITEKQAQDEVVVATDPGISREEAMSAVMATLSSDAVRH
ncbi:hypothetical protein [Parendozoicomonas haliclonae]|uniref:Uncharacterized protein n=1 Tax=Parendozoicomonas haliclonae TaxID=1960125 RepID=A0A1X7ALR9_9GAMM|nr:hypothetical protein [Parendozoicomonas haliclonae]SMA48626.1 hypothetical protein EHSB41UT_02820 [Parendozoicomonas haliclonae]